MQSSKTTPAGLRRIVVISDFQSGRWEDAEFAAVEWFREQWLCGNRGLAPQPVPRESVEVTGGYLERLPLAVVKEGLADCGEIWTHRRGAIPIRGSDSNPLLTHRTFQMARPGAPFASNDMLGHIEAFGPPSILCVWGLGVGEDVLSACSSSFKIYNSIDACALRVPSKVSRHFDLVLTGSEWQSEVVRERHPAITTAILPIGPEFASEMTFKPLNLPKTYDVIYVAAAQAYKRHDILFEALAKLPRSVRTLCVCGYGELIGAFRRQVVELGIDVDFVGPPGVPFEEVNRLMNQARLGVVCGVDDGAPAILTEYMLAGIPVLANSELRCGLQYITPTTGRTASAENFHHGIGDTLRRLAEFNPRQAVLQNWTWPHSVRKLSRLIASA
ncbi:glycosyltransferase family 4 protein [Rhizobium tubonense]|uniref:Glycosyl transferase family 1 n=1 Tax=Rhizobium tubonense TaxID=484088 RepID=A0A2W4CU88_9HYPH|nr:glycosyltransferase family 4 protein [Rhizobium tubonense]PZM08964.1 glycosyl transferase family 1 [Rhizobium tubonense]